MMRYGLIVVLVCWIAGVGYAVEPPTLDVAAPTESAVTISAKLDRILDKQEDMLHRLDAIDEQLRIIKVRTSQKH